MCTCTGTDLLEPAMRELAQRMFKALPDGDLKDKGYVELRAPPCGCACHPMALRDIPMVGISDGKSCARCFKWHELWWHQWVAACLARGVM